MKYRINLLPTKDQTVLDRAIFFSFHYLRYILVITQLVVICVFLYRFNVDQEIVDTKDTLYQKLEIIRVSQPLLKEGEKMYRRSENITQLLSEQSTSTKMVSYVLSRFPEDFFLDSMHITKDSMTLSGKTGDANIIRSFYKKLQNEKRFSNVDLESIQRAESGYEFKFTLTKFI